MRYKQRWLAACAVGLLAATASACGSSKSDGKADDTGGGDGGNAANNGGPEASPEAGTTQPDSGNDLPPDLNFIPANEGKCDLVANPDLRAVAREALGLIKDYPTRVATDLELCPTAASDRACARCTANPFLAWVDAVDKADMGGTEGKAGRMALSEYFRRALQYPLRELLVIDTADDARRLMLAQGRVNASCLDPIDCHSFDLQPESQESDCKTLTQNLEVASASDTEVTSKEGNQAFSFYVPLVSELPTYPLANPTVVADVEPNSCPSAATVGNEEDFHAFLLCHPNLRVSITTPTLKTTTNADGIECFQLSGLVATNDLPLSARTLVDPYDFEDPDYPGFMRISLSARLFAATTALDPKLTEVTP